MAELSRWAIFVRAFLLSLLAASPTRVGGQSSSEDAAWQTALSANTPDAYHAYLSQFPSGQYVGDAVTALRSLGAFGDRPRTRDIGDVAPSAPAGPTPPPAPTIAPTPEDIGIDLNEFLY